MDELEYYFSRHHFRWYDLYADTYIYWFDKNIIWLTYLVD